MRSSASVSSNARQETQGIRRHSKRRLDGILIVALLLAVLTFDSCVVAVGAAN